MFHRLRKLASSSSVCLNWELDLLKFRILFSWRLEKGPCHWSNWKLQLSAKFSFSVQFAYSHLWLRLEYFFNTLGGIISHPVDLLMLNDFSDSGLNFSFTYWAEVEKFIERDILFDELERNTSVIIQVAHSRCAYAKRMPTKDICNLVLFLNNGFAFS